MDRTDHSVAPPSRAKREAEFRAAAALLASSPYAPAADLPSEMLDRHYGVAGSVSVLASEFERTLGVDVGGGQRLILKLSDRPEAWDSFRFQSAVLRKLEKASDLQLPRVLETVEGKDMFGDGDVSGYVQTGIIGTPLHALEPTGRLMWQVGASLGQLGRGLGGVDAPACDRPVLWQIGMWPWLKEFRPSLPSGPTADLVEAALANYLLCIEPHVGELDWQITHNDPSPFNMFQTDGGIAFIDFGDGGWNPRIQDLVIAASHFVTDANQPLGGASPIIAGFHAVQPLTPLEMRLLVGMIRARQAALILINYWRAEIFPQEAQYIKKNVRRAETGLMILSALGAEAAERAVHAATTHAA